MAALSTLSYSGSLQAQTPGAAPTLAVPTNLQRQVQAVRVDTPPVIDGRLDDEVWQLADAITDFHQIRPGDGTQPSERTEVYVLYDDNYLYVGARMFDSEPHLIAAPVIRHGQGMPNDDRLVVILDPFNTRRTGYRFETNLNAARHDALYTSVTSFQIDWSTIWEVATSVEDDAWIAEIAIPFKSIPFDPAVETWGFNFGRAIRRRGEEIAWVSQNRTYNPSISGQLVGMSGLSAGAGLDVVPSMAATRSRRYDPDASETDWAPSLDVFYRLTPSLNAALTINTDFSATEVDNRQVNLTRFNLFFPEKRDFFLNDADLFQFGNISGMARGNQATSLGSRENARPYFSRRIGLSPTGEPVDINYGGRISGRIGRWNIGTLAIQQDGFGDVDTSNLLVTRMSANVLEDSALGFIFTHGDPASDQSNSVFGVDFEYLNNNLLPNGRTLGGDLWYQRSDTAGLSGDDAAWGFGLRMPNNTGWRGRMGFKEVQRNFNPAMGYVNRTDIRDLTVDLGYTHFSAIEGLQTIFSGVDAQRVERISGGLQSEVLQWRLLELQSSSRDNLNFAITRNRENVRNPFVLYRTPDRQVGVDVGDYTFNEYSVSLASGGQRRFAARVNAMVGDFYDGDRTNLGGTLTWNQSRHFVMSASYDWNDISLPQGDFITRLTSLNTQVAFSSTLFWISLLQYDNVSEEIGLNTRLHWIPRAGQEGFIVFNHNLEDRERTGSFSSDRSDFSVKFRYTIRF